MLLPVRDQGSGRRRRSYSHGSIFHHTHKAAGSSRLSLLSTFTAQSSGSNGSNSTVTQESYHRSTKKRRSSTSKRKKEEGCPLQPAMEAVEEASLEDDTEAAPPEDVDVFAFLVDDTSRQQASNDNPSTAGVGKAEPQPVPYPEDAVDEKDFHSDSGVSMNDGSLIIGKTTLHPLMPVPVEDHLDELSHHQWQYPRVPKPQSSPPGAQEICHDGLRAHDHPDIGHQEQGRLSYPTTTPSVFTDDATIPLSTDHLAALLASRDSPPLFKAFKKTNYRILLQLQDEIVELEEELSRLDTYDGSRWLDNDASTAETLRRLSWRWGQRPFDLYKAKADVLSRLQIRMDQYYKAIDLSERIYRLQPTNNISSDEVGQFRDLLVNHLQPNRPVSTHFDTSEALHLKFLDDPTDMLYPTKRQSRRNNATSSLVEIRSLVPLLLPLLLFKLFYGVINRLLIVGLTLAFSLYASASTGTARWIGAEIEGSDQHHTQRVMLASASVSLIVGLFF